MKKCLAMRLYLLAHKCHKMGGVICRINRVLNSVDLPYTAELDPNVVLSHNGLGVVIHERAKIGYGTVIQQNVTIGGRGQSGVPIIGKNVFIGAGACVLGGIIIGDNARIGANAVVIEDVPDNCTAIGVPAKIIENNENHIVNPLLAQKIL